MVAFIPALITGLSKAAGKMGMSKAASAAARTVAKGGSIKSAAGSFVRELSPKHTKILKAGAFATGILTESMKKLHTSLENFMQVNERLAVVNSTFGKESSKNSAALRGAEQGFGLAAKAMTEFRILGFKNSSKGMLDLATRMKISGQDTGKMMKTFQGLLGKGGVNEQNLGDLAKTITQTSLKYNTTTDSLIGALDKLSSNLIDLNITGGTESTATSTQALAAAVGPQLADQAGKFMSLLTSLDMENLNASVRLGLEGIGDRLSRGDNVSAPELIRAIDTASAAARSMVGQSGDVSRRALSQLGGTIGEIGKISIVLSDGISKQAEVAFSIGGVIDSIKGTFEHLKATFLSPFQIALAEMAPAFKTMTKSLFMLGGAFLNLIGAFSPLISFVFDIISLVARVFAFIVQAMATIVDMVGVVVKPFSKAWEFVTGRGDESVGDNKLDFSKIGADFKSLGQTMGIESATTEIVESNKNLSKTFAVTSQHYVSHSNKLSNTVKNITNNSTGNTANQVKNNVIGATSNAGLTRTSSQLGIIATATQSLVSLGEDEKTRLIAQDLQKGTENKDVASRLYLIADYAARENAATWAEYAQDMKTMVKLTKGINSSAEITANQAQNPDPLPANPGGTN